ncbi:MAG: response regulator, partial [Thermoguttaceae bacterium]
FDTFTQLDRSMESKHGGIGIGLSLVKGLVEMHEGSIDARSEGPGEGSEFTVNLPIIAGEPMPDTTTQDVCLPPVLPQRILVVDDQVVVARSIACLLEAMGHDVCEAYDGEEALETMVEYRPDVVLCDIVMPKFNGYEFARHVRGQSWGRDVLLIAYSGSGMREHVEKSLEAGFDHHLIKPLKIDALMSVLEELQQEPV